jgi:hypothetical protein
MDSLATPTKTVSLIARNLVPAVGLVCWSAGNLLVLYYLDTILSFAVVVLLVAPSPDSASRERADRCRDRSTGSRRASDRCWPRC